MLDAFNEASGRSGKRRREIANTILQGAGDYLPGHAYLSAFIRAEISDEEAERIMSDRRAYIERARYLVPGILKLVGARSRQAIISTLSHIDDCCSDFPIILRSPHRKKARKDVLKLIRDLYLSISNIDQILIKSKEFIELEYEDHHRALTRRFERFVPRFENIDQFLDELRYLKFAAEVATYKDKVGEGGFYIGDNKAKTHVVECAYSLVIHRGTPQFVTTPGSDFSLLCSLIFELATGVEDASLAGAINRFSRSASRLQLDSEEAGVRWENSDEFMRTLEADNFAAIAERIERLSKELIFWEDSLESGQWDEFAKLQVALRVFDAREQIEAARNEYGPRLVWASQVSEHDHEQRRREVEEAEECLLRTEIELGRLRREGRRS